MKKYKKIFISGGHGKNGAKKDPGAVSEDGETTERSVIVRFGEQMKAFSKNNPQIVLLNFENEMNHDQRVNFVNDICKKEGLTGDNSLYIEMHTDYSLAPDGVCGYHYAGSEESKKECQKFLDDLGKWTTRKLRFNKPDTATNGKSLYTIRNTIPLAFLLEIGSLKEGVALDFLKSDEKIKQTAEIIYKLCLQNLGGDNMIGVSDYAQEAVRWANEKGIITKWDNPQESVTLERLAVILQKMSK